MVCLQYLIKCKTIVHVNAHKIKYDGHAYTVDSRECMKIKCNKLHSMTSRMTGCRKCHYGPCGPCFLCKTQSSKFTHPNRFSHDEYTFMCKFEHEHINKRVCFCYPCYIDIQRHINSPQFRPQWQKKHDKLKVRCAMEGCELQLLNRHT